MDARWIMNIISQTNRYHVLNFNKGQLSIKSLQVLQEEIFILFVLIKRVMEIGFTHKISIMDSVSSMLTQNN